MIALLQAAGATHVAMFNELWKYVIIIEVAVVLAMGVYADALAAVQNAVTEH